MDTNLTLLEAEEHMQKAVEYLIHEFATVRTGKAHPSIVEGINVHVSAYGSTMKLKQLASISTPEPRLIVVQPFDASTLQDVEKALKESKVGINPVTEGKLIRLPIPELTEERRKELVKIIKNMAEESRIRVRSARRDGMEEIKKGQKASEITEDQMHDLEKEIQKSTDKNIAEIDEHLVKKEKELMTV